VVEEHRQGCGVDQGPGWDSAESRLGAGRHRRGYKYNELRRGVREGAGGSWREMEGDGGRLREIEGD
jgi:hypothetical protein